MAKRVSISFGLILFVGTVLVVHMPVAECQSKERAALTKRSTKTDKLELDTSGFRSSAHHWRKITDGNRVIQATPEQPAYSPDKVAEIAQNILLFQRENGGWPKDYDMLAILNSRQVQAVRDTRDRADTSFDNDNIHPQVDYLARAYAATGEGSWRDACLRGFDFMLEAQLPNGGFPQRYPKSSGYSKHITFNDGVMVGIMIVLMDAAENAPQWKWLDSDRRRNAQAAVDRGIECILNCQIKDGGKRTGWCQQHDEVTFEPASARTFELASNCAQDTAAIVRLLMRVDKPSPRVVAAIDSAVTWLDENKLTGIRVERVAAAKEQYDRHIADYDVVIVKDESAPPLWARHYELGTNRPIFADRDGRKRYALGEISRERRTGNTWYGKWPRTLVEKEHSKWRKNLVENDRLPSRDDGG